MNKPHRKYKDYHRLNINNKEEKQCKDCLEWFEMNDDNFGRDRGNKDGFNMMCKKCQKINQEAYYEQNKDKMKNDARERGRRNKENKNKKDLEYYYASKQKRKQVVLAYRETHKKQQAKSTKRWTQYPTSKPKLKQYTIKRKAKEHKIPKRQWISCKTYFSNSCAYCGLPAEKHFQKYAGVLKLQELHKEHVDDKGANDLSNCVPSCRPCNSKKHTYSLEEWYNKGNPIFLQERLDKILKWLNKDYKLYIE